MVIFTGHNRANDMLNIHANVYKSDLERLSIYLANVLTYKYALSTGVSWRNRCVLTSVFKKDFGNKSDMYLPGFHNSSDEFENGRTSVKN